jgi:uncharacterized membrane protein
MQEVLPMRTPARVAGHPIHPMVVVLPIGLWVFSFVCDLIFLATGSPEWKTVARYAVGGGDIGAVLAILPGMIDGLSLRKSSVFRMVLAHLAFNSLAFLLFVTSFIARSIDAPFGWAVAASAIGLIAVSFGGWYGGELVYREGIGVEATPPHTRTAVLTGEPVQRDERRSA